MSKYVVKMDGQKVRMFDDAVIAGAWAARHCRGKIEVVPLVDCGRLPEACGRLYPDLSMPKLVYKPFEAVV